LMVFQDFMYACHQYPGTKAFLDHARAEAEDQVWRLTDHPSLALWCGNNEIEQGWAYWGWRKTMPQRYPDYVKLFSTVLGGVIRRLDPGRSYWPCSESSGPPYGRDPKSPKRGDTHYWEVSVRSAPIEAYEGLRARFVAEFGFSSLPDMATLRAVIPADQLRWGSDALEDRMKWPSPLLREQSPHGNRVIEQYLREYTGLPDHDLSRMAYLSMLLQGFAIQTAVEAWRRYKPYCMGALYWQVNSCWPEIGWASLGYDGRWKALHYMAQRFFAPVLASVQLTDAGAEIWATSDLPRPVSGTMRWWLRSFDGQCMKKGSKAVQLRAGQNKRVTKIDIGNVDPTRTYIHYRLTAGGQSSENVKSFTRFKDLNLPATAVRATVAGQAGDLAVKIFADGPAFFIYIDQGDLPGHFEDNFVQLPCGGEMEISFRTGKAVTAATLRAALAVQHLGG